jgi:hypothetical protein
MFNRMIAPHLLANRDAQLVPGGAHLRVDLVQRADRLLLLGRAVVPQLLVVWLLVPVRSKDALGIAITFTLYTCP